MKHVEINEFEDLSDTHKNSGEQYGLDSDVDFELSRQASDEEPVEDISKYKNEGQYSQDNHYRAV